MWRHWLAELGDGHTLVRYDERGCGLSDRELGELSVETWVARPRDGRRRGGRRPLRAARRLAGRGDRARLRRAASRAGQPPRPLRRLRARPDVARRRGARACGGDGRRRSAPAGRTPNPTFRHLFSMLFLPHGTPEQMAWYDELQRRSTSAETAVRLYEARDEIDVLDVAPRVTRADAGRARARRPRRPGRGGPAARRAHPGRALRPAGVGEPHPARRRAGLASVRGRARRVPRHGPEAGPPEPVATSARASSRSSSWWPPA